MKSEISPDQINFDELITRLLAYIRYRINSGEYTERSLARVLNISQPHLHNVLKGVRGVSIDFADKMMLKFRISALDLISQEEMWNECDERNPEWLSEAGKRKPAGRSVWRDNARRDWRTGS